MRYKLSILNNANYQTLIKSVYFWEFRFTPMVASLTKLGFPMNKLITSYFDRRHKASTLQIEFPVVV